MKRRGAALYVYVVSVALVVMMLGITSLSVLRLERRQGELAIQSLAAQENARAAVEMAFFRIRNDPDWRTTYTHGVETAPIPFGKGTISWILYDDVDTDLNNNPFHDVKLQGVGRVGEAVWLSEVHLESEPVLTFGLLHSHETGPSPNAKKLAASLWLGGYFQPDLPAGAIDWRVNYIDVYCRRDKNVSYSINLYQPNPSGLPATLTESVGVGGNAISTNWDWYRFNFATNSGLNPNNNLCFAFECPTSDPPVEFTIDTSLASSPARHQIEGSSSNGWTTVRPSESLRYRVYGTFTTVRMKRREGSWRRVAL